MAPLDPGVYEIVVEHLSQALAVVGDSPVELAEFLCVNPADLGLERALGTLTRTFLLRFYLHQIRHYVVAVFLLEVLREAGGPVGTIDFVGVVEEGMGPLGSALLECLVEAVQIGLQGLGIVMVHNEAFASRSGPLYFLAGLHAFDAFRGDFHLLGCQFRSYLGPAERPAGAVVQVALQSQPLRLVHQILVHLHPLVAQIVDVVALVAFDPVDGGDFESSYTCLGEFLQVVSESFFIYGAAEPPPPYKRLVLRGGSVPVCAALRKAEGAERQSHQGCEQCL